MALNAGNRRSCTQNVSYQSVYEKENDLRSFLFSDEEASDAEDEESGGEDCVTYDPAGPLPKFDKKKGQSEWVGRRICKPFAGHGDCEGIIYASKADPRKKGYRQFFVYYFTDHSFEQMWPSEVAKYLLPEDQGADSASQKRYDALEGVSPSKWRKKKKVAKKKAAKKKVVKKNAKFSPLPEGRSVFFLIDCETTGNCIY